MNAALFEEWVEKCLVPRPLARRYRRHGQFARPQGARVEQLIKSAGAELRYLPSYSPDMNPIEKGLFEAEGLSAQDCRANRRRPDEGARSQRRHLQICRMHKLLRRLRL